MMCYMRLKWKQSLEFFPFFIIFSLIIWEFHIMNPEHTHFPVLPGLPLPPTLRPPHQKKEKKSKSNLCCPYTHWNMVKLPVASPLRRPESFPTRTPARSHQVSILITTVKEFSSMAFCLDCFVLGVGELGVGVIDAFCVPLSQLWVCSHWCHFKRSFLALYSQQEHGLVHGFWW